MVKDFFGPVSLIFGAATYLPYFIEIARGRTRPHLFSWLTWGLIIGLGFILSDSSGGGEGAWIFAAQSIACFLIAGLSFYRGEKNITAADWLAFSAASLICVFYIFTRNAVWSVVLAATVDLLGFLPTVRKSYAAPQSEPALTYFLSFLGYSFSLAALDKFSFVTLFYPSSLVLTNSLFVFYLLYRRRALAAAGQN